MKKLIIGMCAVAFAMVAQAATVNWGVDGIQVNGDWDAQDGDLADGYRVYLFNNAGTYNREAMLDLIAADTWQDAMGSKLADFVAGGNGDGLVNGIGVDDGNFTGYMVILDAATIVDAKNAYVTDIYTVADNSVHTMNFKTFDDGSWINATSSGSGSGWTSVNAPEPTSGLLLLLGMAGLALKRKRA